jgi:hypothetical protein
VPLCHQIEGFVHPFVSGQDHPDRKDHAGNSDQRQTEGAGKPSFSAAVLLLWQKAVGNGLKQNSHGQVFGICR